MGLLSPKPQRVTNGEDDGNDQGPLDIVDRVKLNEDRTITDIDRQLRITTARRRRYEQECDMRSWEIETQVTNRLLDERLVAMQRSAA